MNALTKKIIQKLIDVATGKLKHLYRGQCPDPETGQEARDSGCPACKAIVAAAKEIQKT